MLTFQDDLSKFLVAVPIPQQDAEAVARALVMNVALKFGAPGQILTDQGSNFFSDLFKGRCKLLRSRRYKQWLSTLNRTVGYNEVLGY
jgi:hypothetical protein